MSHDVLELFYLSPVTEAEVDKIISNFRDSAAGWDELKPSIIKTVKDSIKIPLAHIGNLSFDTGIFPVDLKIAKIVPIFKSGDECTFTNYRPVSVLPVNFKNNGKIDVWSVDKLHAEAQHFIWISVWVSEGKVNPYGINYSGG